MNAFFSGVVRLGIIAAVAAGLVAVVACGDDDSGDGKPKVVASLPLIADMARNVAGDRAEVDSLLPDRADPHTYEPSPGDVRKVAEADVVFANGLNLEPGALRIIDANLPGDAVFLKLADEVIAGGAALIPSEEADDPDGNPHVWMDPANGIEYAKIIRDTLIDADPGGRTEYESNYDDYAAQLMETDDYLKETTATVPEANRKIVSTHDAFDYMARAIDFEVAGFVVPGPGQDPSPSDIAHLIETIQDFGIPSVFSEPQTDAEAATLRQIASEAGVEVCTLYSGAFSETVNSYIDIIRFDADELARCLGDAGG